MYDYDWGLRDDFMGQAQIQFSPANIQQPSDMVLTLIETGNTAFLFYIETNLNNLIKITNILV